MPVLCRIGGILLLAGALTCASPGEEPASNPTLSVTVGKSLMVDTEADISRVSVAGATLAETIAINSREIMVNGLLPGETSLVLWEAGGRRIVYNLKVSPDMASLDGVRRALAEEAGCEEVRLDLENNTAFLRGKVRDVVSADRAVLIAGTLGKVINLLYITSPPPDSQVLLKVRFADVERTASTQLGVNLMSTGQLSTAGATSTGQFTLGDALDLLLFRKDFNLSATLTALASRNLVRILAEPNLLAIDGEPASFMAGGEYPYPTVQAGATAGAVTIAFREFGVRLKFVSHVLPDGRIRLHVAPEVSSLDFANGLVYQGFNVPALSTKRVETEVELESGQSFAIAGLLDNQVTETLSKVPGIGDIPVLGKLFQNRTRSTSNSELLIIVTPELVRPVPAGASVPDLIQPKDLPRGTPREMPRTPGMEITGPAPASEPDKTIPLEQLQKLKAALPVLSLTGAQTTPQAGAPPK